MIPRYGELVKFWIVGKKTIDFRTKQEKIVYWGSKKGYGAWTDDLAQATHFKTLGAARGKLAYAKESFNGHDVGDYEFVAECNGKITVNEIQRAESNYDEVP